jgi:hypothetical protein
MHTVHNARVQLLATALNNVGVGAVIAGIVAPIVKGSIGGLAAVSPWLILSLDVMIMAQIVLGRLR